MHTPAGVQPPPPQLSSSNFAKSSGLKSWWLAAHGSPSSRVYVYTAVHAGGPLTAERPPDFLRMLCTHGNDGQARGQGQGQVGVGRSQGGGARTHARTHTEAAMQRALSLCKGRESGSSLYEGNGRREGRAHRVVLGHAVVQLLELVFIARLFVARLVAR